MNNKTFNLIFIVVLIGIIFYGVVRAGKYRSLPNITDNSVMCTMEAKQCPDGSYVGRTGPSCEFAPCPGEPNETNISSEWKTYSDPAKGITFQYPEKFGSVYIREQDWPPKVQVIKGPFSCTNAGDETARTGKTETKLINGRSYCVTTITEGAAGSTYTEYAYAKQMGDKTLYFTFTMRAVQCGNYDEPKKTECLVERDNFRVDNLIDGVIQTAKIL